MYTDHYSGREVIKRLISNHISPYKKRISLAIFFMTIVASTSAAIAKLVKYTIDQVFISHDDNMLMILPLTMMSIYFIKGIAEYYQSYLIKYVGQRILTDLQMKMYEHLLSADLVLIQSFSSGRLISRFTNDISLMRGSVSNLLVGCAKHFLSVLFLTILMFNLEPVLSLMVFIVFPLAVYPIQKLGRRMRKILNQSQEELSNYTATLDETFQSIKIIKSFCTEEIEVNRAKLIVNNILKFYKRAAKLDALVHPIMEILTGLAIGGIMWYGGQLVIDGKTTPGALFAFITAFVSAYRPFKSLVSLNVNLQEGLAAAKRIFHILDTVSNVQNFPNAKNISNVVPTITFQNVGLNFGSRIALNKVNLTIQSKQIIAIVGRSGSGKTSLANLLVRFYDQSSGEIRVGDHNIKDFTLNSLRHNIAYVTQDIILFDASIADNISYGNSGATRKQIIQAAKYADADEFISHLADGYDTNIGAQGSTLSGGQRQKLSIARAFLKDAPILILDEATSGLDTSSESLILKTLRSLRQNKTTIMITHRLSSIVDVDDIIVMKKGSVIERGPHLLLIENKAEYYKLYNRELEEIR